MLTETISFSGRLRRARELLKLSQHEMARKLGVSLRSYSRYENEGRELPMSAMREAAKMGISVTWLLTGFGDPLSERQAEESAQAARRLDAIEEELNRSKAPATVGWLDENSALKDIYRQLIDISDNAEVADDLRARADMLLDLGFASAEAAERREGRQRHGTEEFQRNLRSVTDIYTGILRELDWQPPALTGMAVRDAMLVDGLSEEMARFILGALKHDLSETDRSERK